MYYIKQIELKFINFPNYLNQFIRNSMVRVLSTCINPIRLSSHFLPERGNILSCNKEVQGIELIIFDNSRYIYILPLNSTYGYFKKK